MMKRNIAVSNGSSLPAVVNGPQGLRAFNEFIEDADDLVKLCKWLRAIKEALEEGASTSLPSVEEIERVQPTNERLQRLRAGLDRFAGDGDYDARYDLEIPAGIKFVSERLAALIGSFANARPGSPKVFAFTMLEHVLAHDPTPCSLETTCRKLIEREKPFLPEISEVIAMLKRENELWHKRQSAIYSTAILHDEVLAALRKRRPSGRSSGKRSRGRRRDRAASQQRR